MSQLERWTESGTLLLKSGGEASIAQVLSRKVVEMAAVSEKISVDLASFQSPFGKVLYAYSKVGLSALGFGEEFEELSIPSRFEPSGKVAISEPIETALTEYFDGSPNSLDRVDLDLAESGFYSKCRVELRRIPFGRTVTYGGLAALAGNPRAYRAAASACSSNPVPLFIPCHRVISSDGSMGGYAFGTALKVSLLAFEAKSSGN